MALAERLYHWQNRKVDLAKDSPLFLACECVTDAIINHFPDVVPGDFVVHIRCAGLDGISKV